MSKRIILACLLCALSSGTVGAFEVRHPETTFKEPFASQRETCLNAFETLLKKRFDGLTGITIEDPSFFNDVDATFVLVTFAGVTFESVHGAVDGVITCLFLEGGRQLAHVSATLERPGLMGAARAGLPKLPMLSAGAQAF